MTSVNNSSGMLRLAAIMAILIALLFVAGCSGGSGSGPNGGSIPSGGGGNGQWSSFIDKTGIYGLFEEYDLNTIAGVIHHEFDNPCSADDGNSLKSAAMLDNGEGLVVGAQGKLYRQCKKNGNDKDFVWDDLSGQLTTQDLNDVVLDPTTGKGNVCGGNSNSICYYTSNGGVTFAAVAIDPDGHSANAIFQFYRIARCGDLVIGVGEGGAGISHDGGQTFRLTYRTWDTKGTTDSKAVNNSYAVSINRKDPSNLKDDDFSNMEVIILTVRGEVWHSPDGLTTNSGLKDIAKNKIGGNVPQNLCDATTIGGGPGYVVAGSNAWRIKDNREDIEPFFIEGSASKTFRRIKADGNNLIVVGNNGFAASSTNSGYNWSVEDTGITSDILGAHYNKHKPYVVGRDIGKVKN